MSEATRVSIRGRELRVLYLVFNYPQLSESYIEAEIAFMRRAGVHVEVWRHVAPPASYPSDVPIHEGDFAGAIAQARPDLVHLHWMLWGEDVYDFLAQFGLPVTVRAHTDFTPERATVLAAHPAVARVYLFPHQLAALGLMHPKLVPLPVAYDETLHTEGGEKDARLVVRAAAAQPWRQLDLFLEVAQLCPDHRFVLCLANARAEGADPFVRALLERNRAMASPVEIRLDVPLRESAELMRRAGTYLHTAAPDGGAGMPISIAEAMAAGCRVLVNGAPVLRDLVRDCGESYSDAAHAAGMIRDSLAWDAEQWRVRAESAAQRARSCYASGVLLPPMLEDWQRLAATAASQG